MQDLDREMPLADALVTTLRDWGVGAVFGVSGANIEHLHDAIHRLGGARLRSVLARTEVGAAFMADGRARVQRTLGVCCATSGGGMMNLAVGIAEAYAESVPVLAIVGQVPRALEGRGGFQDSSGIGRTVRAVEMWSAISKHCARVDDPARFWAQLDEAVTAALTGRPGPAVLLVPRDVFAAMVGPRPQGFSADLDALRDGCDDEPEGVDALLEALRAARRPVMIMGTGVARSARGEAVTRFALACGLPVVTTMGDAGAFPNDHPLHLGIVGAAGHPSAHAYLNEQADLLLAVGTSLDVMVRSPLQPALARARVLAVNIDAELIRRVAAPSVVVEADAGRTFEALLRRVRREPLRCPPVERYQRTRYRPELAAPVADASPAPGAAPEPDGLRQSEAILQLRDYLPRGGHVVFDAGNCAAAALHFLDIPRDTTSTIALGMGGMGYSIAAAIGATLGARPGERALVLCGDGAFLMGGFEIHTAVELGLPVLFVVFNNGKHGMCVTRQQVHFDSRVECASYQPVDVAAVVRGLAPPDRLWVGRAASADQLATGLADYHRGHLGGPGVLELCLAREEIPPFAPFLAADAATFVLPRTAQSTSRRQWAA